MDDYFIDIHCHPALKPYGRSFKKRSTTKKNDIRRNRSNSIWYTQRNNLLKKILNIVATLTKFTQSDFSSVVRGGGKVLVVSLYPMEKGMITNVNGVKGFGRLLRNLATGISMDRIKYLQNMPDYFTDLEDEYNYYKQLHDTKTKIGNVTTTYKLVSSFNEIELDKKPNEETVYIVISIEGCHVFNTGLQLAGKAKADKAEVLKNINKVKQWAFAPFFVTLAHHFDNELCGHAKSITGLVDKVLKQQVDPNKGLLPLGLEVIKALLSTQNGKRIHIDVKHMNVNSRYEYYAYLKENHSNEDIPIIVSHGAVNGKNNPDDDNVLDDRFNSENINFYDDEIFRIARSNGIFGVQLDERRILNKKTQGGILNNTSIGQRNMLRTRSKFIWLQIEHMAKYLDVLNANAWDIQALGTDFDGIIDPLNGWWTAKELGFLDVYLESHATEFLNSARGQSLKPKNKLTAKTIVDKFMFKNAQQFLERYFV